MASAAATLIGSVAGPAANITIKVWLSLGDRTVEKALQLLERRAEDEQHPRVLKAKPDR